MASKAPATSRLIGALIIDEDAFGTAVEILILATVQCPQEGDEPSPAEQKRHRNENNEIAHRAGLSINLAGVATRTFSTAEQPPASRMALAMTTIEDSDMAIAAINGVT